MSSGKNLSKLLKIIMSGFHFITSSIVTFDQVPVVTSLATFTPPAISIIILLTDFPLATVN